MNKGKIIILTSVIILTVLGFVLGNAVNAAISGPGSSSDPLVTKSYVDAQLNKLQNQLNDLKAEVEQLKKK
ncbi:hypothetical protein Tfer_3059 [Thermincola ferriacetica]|uniref:Uncharacterized protein n=2 Tax=Thermincola TaxID=278993 RepID=D5XD34_THEPJ|nr:MULTISPECIES: hypothetical protein [Thermincola]ADG83710.1 conserved hypothetical protein [Thermincola potens JR]KNZ68421.1 hypothetical protein Tfer_3059 [Thermincola ferriacetica]